MTMHFAGDSTLKLYPRPSDTPGEKPKAVTITHRVNNENYGIYCTENINSGATIQEMTRGLRAVSDETLAGIDCTIVACMFNANEANANTNLT